MSNRVQGIEAIELNELSTVVGGDIYEFHGPWLPNEVYKPHIAESYIFYRSVDLGQEFERRRLLELNHQ